jgi:hypothetical protein
MCGPEQHPATCCNIAQRGATRRNPAAAKDASAMAVEPTRRGLGVMLPAPLRLCCANATSVPSWDDNGCVAMSCPPGLGVQLGLFHPPSPSPSHPPLSLSLSPSLSPLFHLPLPLARSLLLLRSRPDLAVQAQQCPSVAVQSGRAADTPPHVHTRARARTHPHRCGDSLALALARTHAQRGSCGGCASAVW